MIEQRPIHRGVLQSTRQDRRPPDSLLGAASSTRPSSASATVHARGLVVNAGEGRGRPRAEHRAGDRGGASRHDRIFLHGRRRHDLSFRPADHAAAVATHAQGSLECGGRPPGFPPGALKQRQPAYKPGSGWHAGKPACVTAIPLGRRLPGASSNLPGRADLDIDPAALALARGSRHAVPIRSCSRWGLPSRQRCRRRGALLPHRFTLTAAYATPAAVCSLWHFPWARTRRMLSGTACPRSPDFPPRQPFGFAGAAVRPTDREGMGGKALFVKRRGGFRHCGRATRWYGPGRAWQSGSAASPASTHRRRRRRAPGGNGAGTP
jgi:hypothetical protein